MNSTENTKIILHPKIKDLLELHTTHSKGEIMGWLIGYKERSKKGEELKIISTVGVNAYADKSIIHANADINEFNLLLHSIPLGIGVVGMYHSHPVNVFHSATDDRTLQSFASIYPSFLSIVTNGKITKMYVLDHEENKTIEVTKKVKLKKTKPPKFEKLTVLLNCPEQSEAASHELAEKARLQALEILNNKGKKMPSKIEINLGENSTNIVKLQVFIRSQKDLEKEDLNNMITDRIYAMVNLLMNNKNNDKNNYFWKIEIMGVPFIFPKTSPFLEHLEEWKELWSKAKIKHEF